MSKEFSNNVQAAFINPIDGALECSTFFSLHDVHVWLDSVRHRFRAYSLTVYIYRAGRVYYTVKW